MESGYIISLGAAIAVVMGVRAYYQRLKMQRTLAPPPVGTAVARWTGSYKTGPAASPWSRAYQAQLEFFDWGVRVSSCWPWKRVLPIWEFRYQELRNVQHVRWPPLGEGVLLRTDAPEDPRVFITTHASQILVQFAMRGVSIEQEVVRLKKA